MTLLSAPLGGQTFIADKSAWERARKHKPAEWSAAMRARQIVTCPVVMLEMLYSARNRGDFDRILNELQALPSVPIHEPEWTLAVGAMQTLSSKVQHRVKLPDLLIAAAAHSAGVGVLHYDAHYDMLAQVLHFESRWLYPRGSVD